MVAQLKWAYLGLGARVTRPPRRGAHDDRRRVAMRVLSKQLATILTAQTTVNSFETVARLGFYRQPFLILMDGLAEHNKMWR